MSTKFHAAEAGCAGQRVANQRAQLAPNDVARNLEHMPIDTSRGTNQMPDIRKCGKCGSDRNQVVGQSVSLVGAFVQCLACGYLTLATSPKPVTASVDKRRIERLVHAVIDESALPCELLMVTDAPAGWQVTVRTRTGHIERFEVKSDALSVMRAAVARALPLERP